MFTDNNGDDKPDEKKVLFNVIGGKQHDHGIHAFCFGPDGKLYFNFGNASRGLKTPDNKIIIDKAEMKSETIVSLISREWFLGVILMDQMLKL